MCLHMFLCIPCVEQQMAFKRPTVKRMGVRVQVQGEVGAITVYCSIFTHLIHLNALDGPPSGCGKWLPQVPSKLLFPQKSFRIQEKQGRRTGSPWIFPSFTAQRPIPGPRPTTHDPLHPAFDDLTSRFGRPSLHPGGVLKAQPSCRPHSRLRQ